MQTAAHHAEMEKFQATLSDDERTNLTGVELETRFQAWQAKDAVIVADVAKVGASEIPSSASSALAEFDIASKHYADTVKVMETLRDQARGSRAVLQQSKEWRRKI